VVLAYGNNNNDMSDHIDLDTAKHAGVAQTNWMKRVNMHANDHKAVAGDIELGWDHPTISKGLAQAASSSGLDYYEYGDANNCPPVQDSCYGSWTFADVGAVSFYRHGVPLPEIYHGANAEQWAKVARHWDDSDNHCPEWPDRVCYYFAGATSEPHSCGADLDPKESWRQLQRHVSRRTVGRNLIYWNPNGCP
jgi:hypothetical protein